MTVGDRIRKLGFKRWYERKLIEGHAYLVTSLLGVIVMFAGVELIGGPGALRVSIGVAAGLIGVALGVFGTSRYFRILVFAENLGGRATCPRCRTYASFNVLASGSQNDSGAPENPTAVWLKVKCRPCGNEWMI